MHVVKVNVNMGICPGILNSYTVHAGKNRCDSECVDVETKVYEAPLSTCILNS